MRFLFAPKSATAKRPNVPRLLAKRKVDALIQALSYPNEPAVRIEAAEALGKLRAADAVDPLLTALTDTDASVRAAAASALAVFTYARNLKAVVQRLCGAMHDDDETVRIRASHTLAFGTIVRNEWAIDPLATTLATDEDALVRGTCLKALRSMPHSSKLDDALFPVARCLDDVRQAVHDEAGQTFQHLLAQVQSAAPLLNMITVRRYREAPVAARLAALKALPRVAKPSDATDVLRVLTAVKDDPNPDVQLAAEDAYNAIGRSLYRNQVIPDIIAGGGDIFRLG